MKSLLAPLALCASAGIAHAFEDLEFGEVTIDPGFALNLTATNGPEGMRRGAYGYLDLAVTWERKIGDLTFGAELYGSVEGDKEAEGRKFYVYDDPYVDLGLWIEGERFGYLAYTYTSSAIGEHCIEAPTTGDNFGVGDHVTVATCPSFDARSVLFYRTPDLIPGLQLAASYMPATRFEGVDAKESAESTSVALLLDRTDARDAQWTGSVGMEKVLKIEGGGPEPTAFQAGLNWSKDDLTLGGALSAIDNGDGTESRGYGLGISQEIGEKLALSLGVNHSESRADKADLDETSVALIGMYSVVPDKVILDGGIWRVASDDAGVSAANTYASVGLSLYY